MTSSWLITRSMLFTAALLLVSDHALAQSPRVIDTKSTVQLKQSKEPSIGATVNKADQKLGQQFFKLYQKKDFPAANALIDQIKNPTLKDIMLWSYYRAPQSGASFKEIVDFYNAHPTWPDRSGLQVRAEEVLNSNVDPQQIISFFDANPPLTPKGVMLYLQTLIQNNQLEKAQKAAKTAWTKVTFSPAELTSFLETTQNWLSTEDYQQKIDNLMGQSLWDDAEALIPFLKSDQQELIRERLKFIRADKQTWDKLWIKMGKRAQADPIILFERLKNLRQQDRVKDAMLVIEDHEDTIADFEKSNDANKWWQERNNLIRQALADKDYKTAYQLAAHNGYQNGVPLAEAEFVAGWIALTFLDKPGEARKHFERLYSNVASPISLSRGAYWVAQTYKAENDSGDANEWLKKAAQFKSTFYGQLALAELDPSGTFELPTDNPDPAIVERLSGQDITQAYLILPQLNQPDLQTLFFQAMLDNLKDEAEYAALASIVMNQKRPDHAVLVARRALSKQHFIPQGYPVLEKAPTTENADLPLVHGVIRQESNFDKNAVSSSGALGLMQLLPTTAREVALAKRLGYSEKQLTADPQYNANVGSIYLGKQIDAFGGSYILAVAAYNAGPGRVKQWLNTYGDPRRSNTNPLTWIELIPFNETRNYVQRVLENTMIYRKLMGETVSNDTILKELKRGTSQ